MLLLDQDMWWRTPTLAQSVVPIKAQSASPRASTFYLCFLLTARWFPFLRQRLPGRKQSLQIQRMLGPIVLNRNPAIPPSPIHGIGIGIKKYLIEVPDQDR